MNVETAIVGFIFVCIVMPRLVKNKTQFYAALGMVLVSIVLHGVAAMFTSEALFRFVGAAAIFLQAACILLLVMATGGISAGELAGEMGRAFEVIRRGETEKTVIVPLTGERPRRREEGEVSRRVSLEEEAPRPPKPDSGSIPLDE